MKFVLSHGGAALPYALGRLARNHAISQGKYADPRLGFEAMYFDSCVFDSDALEYLAKKATPGRIMLGSDMPFPIGDPVPRGVIERARFSPAEKTSILGETAQTVFRIRSDCWCRGS
jgi:aminocarboxymuconate-semialdehyde decarboxylase